MDMSGYTGSNFYRAEDLEPGVLIETTIVSIGLREFEDGAKPVVYTDYQGKGLVLNPTRAKALCRGFGTFSENWVGKPIVISLGETVYAGKTVGAVVVDALVAPGIGSEPRPGIVGGRPQLKSVETPPPPKDAPDGPNDLDDDIPF